MNETVDDLIRHRIAAQHPVPVIQHIAENTQFFFESFRRVVVMMEMDVELAEPGATHVCQRIDVFGTILVLRKEKRVLRRSAIDIAKRLKASRILFAPAQDSRQRIGSRGTAPLRFIVIADRDEDIGRLAVEDHRRHFALRRNVSWNPQVHSARLHHAPAETRDESQHGQHEHNSGDGDQPVGHFILSEPSGGESALGANNLLGRLTA